MASHADRVESFKSLNQMYLISLLSPSIAQNDLYNIKLNDQSKEAYLSMDELTVHSPALLSVHRSIGMYDKENGINAEQSNINQNNAKQRNAVRR